VGEPGWWEAQLNTAQRDAVTHGEGPLLVVAGAGTGKTWTLACRVARLIESGTPPERVLLLTFTRRAAQEMLARAARLTAQARPGKVWGGTFHAVANRLLRQHGRAVGLHPDFTVMDQADGADLMNLIRGELGFSARDRRFPRKETLAAVYSRTVNAGSTLGEVMDRAFPWCRDDLDDIRSVFQAYTARKRAQHVLDYDDLLLYWNALTATPGAGRRVGELFDHILVDEYQDTNAVQAQILRGMRRTRPNITVVGDDAQAIYGFRSATVRNILEFPSEFPGTRVVKLEQNYRSTKPILDVSNAVIARSPQRHQKTLWTERQGARLPELVTCLDEAEQSDLVCRTVLRHREEGVPLRRQAVLFRAAHHSDQLEVELTRRNIPFVKYGGLKFLEAAHVKDVLALLRVLENPRDQVSWFRVLQLLDGMGPVGAARLMADLGVGGEQVSASVNPSPLARLLDAPPEVAAASRHRLSDLTAAFADCVEPGMPAASQIERLSRFLEPVFAKRYESAAARLRDLEQLEQIAARYPSRARFLTDLALDPPSSTGDLAGPPLLDEDYLILSTIHSAKGCEWDVVFVIHAADGMIPSDMATGDADEVEEERRLLYVALTRARDALHVSFPLRYYRRPRGLEDGHAYSQVSRFLPEDVQALFERRTLVPDEGIPPTGTMAEAGIDDFLAGLWRS